jgi:hypothetical protein
MLRLAIELHSRVGCVLTIVVPRLPKFFPEGLGIVAIVNDGVCLVTEYAFEEIL